MILILSVQDKQKGGINKKKKAPKPPLQIKLNHAPPVLQSSQPQPEVTSSVGSGFVVRVGHDVSKNKNQSSVKPDRKEKPVQEERKNTLHSRDKNSSILNSSPKLNGKHIQTPKIEDKLPKNTTTLNIAVSDKKLKSSLDVARKCRNDFPPFLSSTQEQTNAKTTTATAKPNNLPSHLESEVPQFQTLTLNKTHKKETKSDDPRFNPVKSPREDLLSSIRNSRGINSLKPIQGSTPPAPNPPPPPASVTKTAAASQPSKFSSNVDPREDLLSAIRNSGGVKSLRPVKR